jgi:hypothetical protein
MMRDFDFGDLYDVQSLALDPDKWTLISKDGREEYQVLVLET